MILQWYLKYKCSTEQAADIPFPSHFKMYSYTAAYVLHMHLILNFIDMLAFSTKMCASVISVYRRKAQAIIFKALEV